MHFALALAHAAKHKPFNGLFYATVATVIPVLFVAVAVQGNLHERLLRASDDTLQRATEQVRKPVSAGAWLRIAGGGLLGVTAGSAAFLIVVYGAVGEIQALIALYLQRNVGDPSAVLAAAVILALAAVGAPALAVAMNMVGGWRSVVADIRELRASRSSAEDQDPKSPEAAAAAAPRPDKTGGSIGEKP